MAAPSTHLDLARTLLALAGVDATGIDEDRESLAGMLEGGRLARHERFLELHPRIDACVYNHSIVTDEGRPTLHPSGERVCGELFELEVDPAEHEFCSTISRTARSEGGHRAHLEVVTAMSEGSRLQASAAPIRAPSAHWNLVQIP